MKMSATESESRVRDMILSNTHGGTYVGWFTTWEMHLIDSEGFRGEPVSDDTKRIGCSNHFKGTKSFARKSTLPTSSPQDP
jgi:hypothetical protein